LTIRYNGLLFESHFVGDGDAIVQSSVGWYCNDAADISVQFSLHQFVSAERADSQLSSMLRSVHGASVSPMFVLKPK